LRSTDTLQREAAVARLRVIGSRALPRLVALIRSDSDAAVRAAALSALEGLEDARAADAALAALADDDAVAVAAIGVLRGWLTGDHGLPALDAVTGLALTRTRSAAVRLAALDALSDLPRDLVAPVLEQEGGPLEGAPPEGGPHANDIDDPLAVQEWIGTHGTRAALSTLHDLVVRCREREKAEPAARLRQEWVVARGAAHTALAHRGSRVALYDLRESFDAATTPLPLDFLTAITAIGDASCLEPMARAWDAARSETWWRDRLAGAATEIVARERIGARSAALKRVRARWPEFLE
jgi:hypothetical protein